MILLIGEGPEETMSQSLFEVLQDMNIDAVLIDQNRLPINNPVTMYADNGKLKGNIYISGEIPIDIDEITGVYTRLSTFSTDIVLNEGQKYFLELERMIAMNILLEHIDALVVNSSKSQHSNGSKLYQSWIVQQYGFKIPDSIITNDHEQAKAFAEKFKDTGVIYKSASSERSKVAKLSKKDFKRLNNLAGCPALFQSCVPGVDIRIHALATGEIFATEIMSETSDYRYDADRSVKTIDIPDKLKQACVKVTRDLGLYLSGIDVRRTPDGDYYCFEVNPSPAFTWYEGLTGQPISEAVAKMLINGKEIVKSNIVKRKF